MIHPISFFQLADCTNGQLFGENTCFSAVSTDTRTLKEGSLYVALKGENFDGHQFIQDAIAKGCSGVLLNQDYGLFNESAMKVPCIVVDSTLQALGLCGRLNREAFKGKVVGLTGSSGKTSTKNMLECILSEQAPTYATYGNFNNEIGVPLSLLALEAHHKYAVIEMGARKKGDIRYLSHLVKPDVAILLNAGTSHIDIFGSQENIVSGKGEIFTSLKADGLAVVNADDPAKQIWLDSLKDKKVLSFSVKSEKADVFASNIHANDLGSEFSLNYKRYVQRVLLPVPGLHNIANAMAAAAATIHLGFDLKTIASGLNKVCASEGRLNTISCTENLLVIDDSYNANLSSMKSAIDVLVMKQGVKLAILGEMAELGAFSKTLHLELASYLKKSTLDKVYLIGPFAKDMAEIIGNKAITKCSKEDVFRALCEQERIFDKQKGTSMKTNVLIKGSRSTSMNELVDMILKKAAQ